MNDYISWRKYNLEYDTTKIIDAATYLAPQIHLDASRIDELFIQETSHYLSWIGTAYETYQGFYIELIRLIDIYLKVDKISQSTKDKVHARLRRAWASAKNKQLGNKYNINYLMLSENYINYNYEKILDTSIRKILIANINVFKTLFIIINSDNYSIDFNSYPSDNKHLIELLRVVYNLSEYEDNSEQKEKINNYLERK